MTLVLGIGSWDRSGSSILAAILGNVPGIVTLGEINNLWQRGVVENGRCGCAEPFAACPFWSQIMRDAFSDQEGKEILDDAIRISRLLTNHRLIARKLFRRDDPEVERYGQALGRLFCAAGAATGAQVIVDSSKIPWHLDAASRAVGDFALVHLVRDPRGVVNSHKKVVPYDPEAPSGMQMQRKGVLFTTAGWIYRNILLSWLSRTYSRAMRIGYEGFTRRPEEVVGRVLDLVMESRPPLPFSAANVVTLDPVHSISGNPIRFTTGGIEIRADETWRNALSRAEQLLVALATAPVRAIYRARGSQVGRLREQR